MANPANADGLPKRCASCVLKYQRAGRRVEIDTSLLYAFRRRHGLAGRFWRKKMQDDDISLTDGLHKAIRMATLLLRLGI